MSKVIVSWWKVVVDDVDGVVVTSLPVVVVIVMTIHVR